MHGSWRDLLRPAALDMFLIGTLSPRPYDHAPGQTRNRPNDHADDHMRPQMNVRCAVEKGQGCHQEEHGRAPSHNALRQYPPSPTDRSVSLPESDLLFGPSGSEYAHKDFFVIMVGPPVSRQPPSLIPA